MYKNTLYTMFSYDTDLITIHNLILLAPINNISIGVSNDIPISHNNSDKTNSDKTNGDLYKTELCKYYKQYQSCCYGDKCQFAHGTAELKIISRHPRYKTSLCKKYTETGTCSYGDRCNFIHAEK